MSASAPKNTNQTARCDIPPAGLSEFGPADSVITVSPQAVAANWQYLDSLSRPETGTAAVVKANGYGLGATRLAPLLAAAGCKTFFVMSLAEALSLRDVLFQHDRNNSEILVLGGCHRGQEDDFIVHELTPVINNTEQLDRLAATGRARQQPVPMALNVDTGMNRLGLDADETAWLLSRLANGRDAFDGLAPRFLMSHLSAAEDLCDPTNASQHAAFSQLSGQFPDLPSSLANSGGILQGTAYHFQMTRPGIALYGLHPAGTGINGPQVAQAASLSPAIRWDARILQVRSARAGDTVGYNGTHVLTRASRVATIGVGYADGYQRRLGNRAHVMIDGTSVPVIGRVSMDSITVDVTDITAATLEQADYATVLGPGYDLARMAQDAGTIGYEILTRLGQRPGWRYMPAD
ncbi:MAG: alanine racemase [Rhodospirillaceae bacterium]|nr:alanine racemase [Rhodospirillaceae bacterium]